MRPQRGSQCIWTGIRNMEFHTLNKTPLILNHYNVYSKTLIIGTMVTLPLGNMMLVQVDINALKLT